MLYLIIATLLALFAASSFAVWKVRNKFDERSDGRKFASAAGPAAIIWLVILVLVTAGMSITVVGSRSVGIQTSFGKYRDTLSNGFQLTAPWSSTEEFSTRIQSLDLDGDKEAVQVTFKGGGGGDVNLTPRWAIDPPKAGDLWKKYKTFDAVRDKLVNPAARDATRIVTAKYSPNEARSGENLVAIRNDIIATLSADLADDGVKIDSVSVRAITLDKRSQASLDKIVEANNNIERAKAEQERARIDAETAKLREKSGALTPEANQRFCLDLVNNWDVDKNGPLPAGFTCGTTVPFTVTNR